MDDSNREMIESLDRAQRMLGEAQVILARYEAEIASSVALTGQVYARDFMLVHGMAPSGKIDLRTDLERRADQEAGKP